MAYLFKFHQRSLLALVRNFKNKPEREEAFVVLEFLVTFCFKTKSKTIKTISGRVTSYYTYDGQGTQAGKIVEKNSGNKNEIIYLFTVLSLAKERTKEGLAATTLPGRSVFA